jgi:hypothetical protein
MANKKKKYKQQKLFKNKEAKKTNIIFKTIIFIFFNTYFNNYDDKKIIK